MNRAVFLDRDGVLNALAPDPESGLPESPNHLEEVSLLPGVGPAVRALRAAGYLVICITNQPGAAKEKSTLDELRAIQRLIEQRLADEGGELDDAELCFHHPEGSDPSLKAVCDCRKPSPGMLLTAAARHEVDLARSWMVGDSDTDITAGQRAGCRTVLVEHPPSAHRRSGAPSADGRATDLPGAVAFLLAREGG